MNKRDWIGNKVEKDSIRFELVPKMSPEFVTPIVVFLCSEKCPVSSAVYHVGASLYRRIAVVAGPGVALGDENKIATAEEIARNWDAINSMKGATEYGNNVVADLPMLESAGLLP